MWFKSEIDLRIINKTLMSTWTLLIPAIFLEGRKENVPLFYKNNNNPRMIKIICPVMSTIHKHKIKKSTGRHLT